MLLVSIVILLFDCHPERSEGPMYLLVRTYVLASSDGMHGSFASLRMTLRFIENYYLHASSYSHRIQPAVQQRPSACHERAAHLGNLQLCGAVGVDVGQHSHLHVGRQPDPGRDELEAGGGDGVLGQHHRPDPDAAELASGSALWNPLPGSGARIVWSAGRKRCSGSARAGRLRMVRHPNL